MSTSSFASQVQAILANDMPTASHRRAEEKALARQITIGRTLFMDHHQVASEREYKQACMAAGEITYHAHIGLNSWSATADALGKLYSAGQVHGFHVDRAGICLDRRMSLPSDHRHQAIAETGPLLNANDWHSVGQAAPIMPHMGDFMIGFPAALENTIAALQAGVTTIGNLSQYFSQQAPGWKDIGHTTLATVDAIALMGQLRNQGTLVHSYLEDGFGALFYDCTTVAGWAYMEKYIVEELLGAKLSHCIGGLTSDPIKRAGWVFALHEIHDHECIGSMFYGDTISFTNDLAVNSGLVSEYLLWDILAQLKCPTGHAVLPLPLTEGMRIPSLDEIIEAQLLGRRIEDSARRMLPHVDFSQAQAFADTLVTHGKQVFHQALDGLQQAGVDITDPVSLLFVLKQLGPSVFEMEFGAGLACAESIRNRQPIIKTDMFQLSEQSINDHLPAFKQNQHLLAGRKLLIASSDVHEHAIMVLASLCESAGAQVVYLGAEQNPDDIAAAAGKHAVDGILLSTHNGMALAFAEALKQQLAALSYSAPVMIGGVLNQKLDSADLPVNVSSELKTLGFHPYNAETNPSISRNPLLHLIHQLVTESEQ
jgi:methylmalonyl-CoA mutase cobalamin-binding subunit